MEKRNCFFYRLLRPVIILFAWLIFGYTYKKPKNLPENYIVLANHTTDFDPLFVAAAFPRPMYFVGSEHIARWKLIYRLLSYAFSPIMRYKGTLATSAVVEVLRRARSGSSVCLFAEGARSWDGVTCPILPSTGKMIKSARCGLVTYKLVGGYFVSPRWSGTSIRRGHLRGEPVAVYTHEQLGEMTAEEINNLISRDLYEDAYARQLAEPRRYRSKKRAEKLEDLVFLCPQCRAVDSLHSQGGTTTCRSCGLEIRYDEYGMLHGAPFQTVRELSDWQNAMTAEAAENGVTLTAGDGTLATIARHQETPVARGEISLSPQALTCGGFTIPLSDILDMDMHGRRSLVFSVQKSYYELIPARPFNAYKFQLLFHTYKNMQTMQATTR